MSKLLQILSILILVSFFSFSILIPKALFLSITKIVFLKHIIILLLFLILYVNTHYYNL